MAWLTAIGAVAGISQGILGGMASRDAAAAENKARKRQYQAEQQQAWQAYELQKTEAEIQYAWDRARVEQLRADEAQNAAEQAQYGARILDQAVKNMNLNMGALSDQYVVQEGLRGREVAMNAAYEQEQRFDETNLMISRYLSEVNERAASLQGQTDDRLNKMAELTASLALDEKKDHLKFQIEKIASIKLGAESKAKAFSRQGGGRSARRLALDGVYELGAKYGAMYLDATNRDQRQLLANKAINDEMASLSAAAAISYERLANEQAYAIERFNKDTNFAQKQMKDLVVPTFGLAQNQYGREMMSLRNELDAVGGQATTAYRQKTYFDAQKALVGPGPTSIGYSKVQGESWGSTIGSALLGGIQGAMSGATTNKDGKLIFN